MYACESSIREKNTAFVHMVAIRRRANDHRVIRDNITGWRRTVRIIEVELHSPVFVTDRRHSTSVVLPIARIK